MNPQHDKAGLSAINILLLIAYALICLIIGIYSHKKKDASGYMIGGRKLKTAGFVFSVLASYVGGAAVVAYAAYVYRFGPAALAVFAGTGLGFLVFIPYALKIKRANTKFLTLSDWIGFTSGKSSGTISALVLFVVYFGMLLNQFIAGSSILASISGWSYESALSLSALIIGVYLTAGGFNSVIRTDIFQYIVLLALFGIMIFYVPHETIKSTFAKGEFERLNPFMFIAFLAFGIFIVFQSAEYWQRVYAAKNEKVVKRGLQWSAVLVLISGALISFAGLSAHFGAPGIDARDAFASGLRILMPQHLQSLGLVLVFAAIMSSADTIIFVLASSLSVDFMKKFKSSEINLSMARTTKIFILLLTLAGFAFAWFFRDLIQVIIFITGMGFTIIPAVIASFHFKLQPISVWISFLSGIIYIFILILSGNLAAEASIASILISFLALIVSAAFLKIKYRASKK